MHPSISFMIFGINHFVGPYWFASLNNFCSLLSEADVEDEEEGHGVTTGKIRSSFIGLGHLEHPL